MTFENRDFILYNFGKIVSKHRKNLGLTQKQLSKMIASNITFIGDIERGKRNISLITLLLLSNALKVDFLKLIEEFEDLIVGATI